MGEGLTRQPGHRAMILTERFGLAYFEPPIQPLDGNFDAHHAPHQALHEVVRSLTEPPGVGSAQFEEWRKNLLSITVYEAASLARTEALNALASIQRDYRVVYHSSSLARPAPAASGLTPINKQPDCPTIQPK